MTDPGRAVSRFLVGARMLFRRKLAGEQLQQELQFHLDQQIAENIAMGMTPQDARSAALRAFGNPAALRDQSRESWSFSWLESLLRDVRHGVRALARTPRFSILAIIVIGLGIGANVALFTVVHSVLLKPLPFPDGDRLVRVFEANSKGAFRDNIVAGGSFAAWQARSTSFERLAIMNWAHYNLAGTGGQLPEVALAHTASWNLFETLGVQPALGRLFVAADDRPEADGTVILTWGLWKRRYGGDPAILGKTVLLDARPFTIIGALPAWFTYPDTKVQLWTPLYHERSRSMMAMFAAHNFDVIGRLKPGVTLSQANAELTGIQDAIRQQNPDGPINDATNIRPILDADVHEFKAGLYTLLAATGCLLLIACLNIANLLVARAATRRRETAIRTALGGSRSRIMREQIIESLALSIAGGGLGFALAAGALQWLVHTRTDMPRVETIHINATVVLFTAALMLFCGLLAGLIPAVSTGDRQLLRTLHESSRSHSAGHAGVRLRRALLAGQVGLTVVLLVGAGLLIKNYRQLRSVDPGCITQNVLTMRINLPKGSYRSAEQFVAFYEQLLSRTSTLPGVKAVGISSVLPGEGRGRDDTYQILERPTRKGDFLDATTRFVDPGYFSSLQIPLLQGRYFLPQEKFDQGLKAIVSQQLAREVFPGESPLGKHIVGGPYEEDKQYEIVGVVGDTLVEASIKPSPSIYYPLYLGQERSTALIVRTTIAPESLALPVQRVVAGIDPDLPVANVLTMDQVIGQSTFEASFNATLLFAFSAISLLLAAVGLFGVLSYIVAQRTTEIGIRIALGAQREQVLRLMLSDGLRPALAGLILGLIASAAVTRLIRTMLYGTPALDPVVYLAVSATLLAVAMIACLIPAWRASRLDPMAALRTE